MLLYCWFSNQMLIGFYWRWELLITCWHKKHYCNMQQWQQLYGILS